MSEALLPLAIVTGAAHRIGRAIAVELANQGFAIGLHYHHAEHDAEELASQISVSPGMPVYPLAADLRDPAQIDEMFSSVADLPHPLRVLVNSAAVMAPGNLVDMPPEIWDDALNLNLRAPWLCARTAARLVV
jgi:NAD(P)-dependent dehydrogenase (short-subunit alcohol dehydrogenase family)